MNIAAILTLVIAFLQALPKLIAAGVDIYQATQKFVTVLTKVRDENRDPTSQEWDTLHAQLRADEQALQADDPAQDAQAVS
jgi:hypothetical protein